MSASRKIEDLHPRVAIKAREFLALCEAQGIDILITCTLRNWMTQAGLYAQGRTTPGSIVTNARPGDSAHNYGLAFDVVPLRDGKPVWGTTLGPDKALWERVGAIGESVGLEWSGRWKKFPEFAHFQDLGGMTIAQLKADSINAQGVV